jgi:8-oxo-dGTP diphosphatase
MKLGIDYIWVSSGCVIYNKHWKIFMAKRGKEARDDIGKWEFPWWPILFQEDRKIAAKRNIIERHWFHIEIENLLWVYDVIDKDKGDHWISTTYVCKYISWEPKIVFPTKCEEIGWFDIQEILHMDLSRITKFNLHDIINNKA